MKIDIQTTSFLAAIALGSFVLGCSPAPATSAPPSEKQTAGVTTVSEPGAVQAPEKTGDAKTSAPVNVSFSSSAKSGNVVLTLKVEALADIPRGVGRIVIPDNGRIPAQEIKVLKGALEVDFGAIPRGEARELQVTLDVPQSRSIKIFAGVDCHITSGILMHKTATPLTLGE